MVRVAEQQGALIAQVIRGVLDRIDLTPAQRELYAASVETRRTGKEIAAWSQAND